MELKYNLCGAERKRLVGAISEIAGAKATYLGMPSMAYRVGDYTVDRNGTVNFENSNEAEYLIAQLKKKGFEVENEIPNEPTGLTISLPLEKVNIDNMTNLLKAKGGLIQKALGIPATPFEICGDSVSFPWFATMPTAEQINAYSRFVGKLCAMTKKQKHVTVKEKEIDNEKYAFRCLLLRLGFIGAEYKEERKILLSRLFGSSAFREGKNDVSRQENG